MPVPNFKLLRGKDYDVPNFNTVEVMSNVRRIRARWTPEIAQDIERFHNVDIEEELTRLLSEQISEEIDREIMRTIGQDLVPVQPMNGPVGNISYLDYVYGGYNFKKFKLLRE